MFWRRKKPLVYSATDVELVDEGKHQQLMTETLWDCKGKPEINCQWHHQQPPEGRVRYHNPPFAEEEDKIAKKYRDGSASEHFMNWWDKDEPLPKWVKGYVWRKKDLLMIPQSHLWNKVEIISLLGLVHGLSWDGLIYLQWWCNTWWLQQNKLGSLQKHCQKQVCQFKERWNQTDWETLRHAARQQIKTHYQNNQGVH